MIIVVASVKGGTGKTTISTNLSIIRATNASDVLLVDADTQKSASDFATVREEENHLPSITCTSLIGRNAGSEIRKLESKFDDIIIDVGGRDSSTLRSVLLVADVLIVPFLPSQLDAWALELMNNLVGEVIQLNDKLRSFVILNKVDTNPRIALSNDALEVSKEYKFLTLHPEISLGYRVAYRRAVAEGISVVEYSKSKRDDKAIKEITELYEEAFNDA